MSGFAGTRRSATPGNREAMSYRRFGIFLLIPPDHRVGPMTDVVTAMLMRARLDFEPSTHHAMGGSLIVHFVSMSFIVHAA